MIKIYNNKVITLLGFRALLTNKKNKYMVFVLHFHSS